MSRFVVLDDERNLLLGIDFDKLFKKDVVYEIIEFMGEIIVKPLGKFALPTKGSDVNHVVYDGRHLLTKEENIERIKNIS